MASPKPVNGRKNAEPVLAAAGSFTGLWALTWMGASALGVSTAVQGGFAVGSVMASSGLVAMWWKSRALKHLSERASEDDAAASREREGEEEPREGEPDPFAETRLAKGTG